VKASSDAQVRKLMEEMSKHGRVGVAAMMAGMDRKTARKYVKAGKLPSEMKTARTWKTRDDPFEEDWPELERLLEGAPELEAKTLLEDLLDKHPGRYEPGQLRTLQRRVRRWRATKGPDQEVMLAQRHRPGEASQGDFTWMTKLGVTIAGELFVHMLFVFVLPFSNWTWATVCRSESMAALRRGLQRALFQLGRVTEWHQTDNSTAATHRVPKDKQVIDESGGRRRPFNEDYLALMRHFGMKPRTTEVNEKEQNGDVEARNGALKRKLEQMLLLRGSRDFEDVAAWQRFVDEVNRKANKARSRRVTEELSVMRELSVDKLPEYKELTSVVSEWSTIRVKHNGYSVPSRLIGHELKIHLYEDHIEAYLGNSTDAELICERLRGRGGRRIDYRHVIWSLVRKPGGFARYVYREEMFPSPVFRKAYDAIQTPHRGTSGDLDYLRILHLAATTFEADVEAALELLLDARETITSDRVKAVAGNATLPAAPALEPGKVDLTTYDQLLGEVGT
jgi:hypothetical protein